MRKDKVTISLGTQVARGSAWTIAMRWSGRVVGLVSTIALARLLTPADFGVVTIAMIVAGTIEIFRDTGQNLALIRHPAPTRDHYDTAWTISLILGATLSLIIWLSAPVTVLYFHEPRAVAVLHVIAFRTLILGFENVGIVNFWREFRFGSQFAYRSVPSLVSFVIVLASAVVLRNYWALVIGIISQQLVTILLSYVMEPYRPRLSLSKVHEIWSFSVWTLVQSAGSYLNAQIDKFAIGGFSGAATMGRYEVATDVGTSATAEINTPVVATLFPVMAKIQSDHAKRRELYLSVFSWSALICTSTSVGVALVTSDFVDLLLGHQWVDAKPLVPWLALAFGVLGLSSSVYAVFNVIGQPRVSAKLQWTRLAGLFICISPVAYFLHSALALAITRLVVTAAITPTLLLTLARALDLDLRDFWRVLWRPIVASLVMTAAILELNGLISFVGPLRLALDVSAGAASYTASLLAMWLIVGRPSGPESVVWRYLSYIQNGISFF